MQPVIDCQTRLLYAPLVGSPCQTRLLSGVHDGMKKITPFVPPPFDADAIEADYVSRAKRILTELRWHHLNPDAYTADEYADLLGEIWALSDLSPGAAYLYIDYLLGVSSPEPSGDGEQ
jgi:hypothetical protein